jgi:hypothetical protein
MDLRNNNLFLELGCPIPTPTEAGSSGVVELLQAQTEWIARVGIPAPVESSEDGQEKP